MSEIFFQHSKSNFVTLRGYVISAICLISRNTCIAESISRGSWEVAGKVFRMGGGMG